jgi:hypothetical protein
VLILFGVRRLRRQLGVVLLLCQRCQQPCAHSILCVKTFFTLFFIPVIPLGSRYYLVCSMCAGSSPIDKADAERLRHAAVQQAAQPAQMTPDGPITPYGRAELPSATPALGLGSPNPPSGPPQGWYPDPSGGSMQRWWDGARWTDHVQAMAPPAP